MADNLVVTGIEFDSTPLLRGVTQSEKKLNDLEKTVNKTAASTERASKKYVASAQEQAHHQRRIIELEKQWQAQQAKREALAKRNAERRANSEVIHQFQRMDTTSRRGARGLGELRESMASLAAQSIGAHSVFGRFANVLGGLALSGGLMVGVMAGVSALGLLWNKLTSDARENKRETREAIEELEKLAEMRATQGQADKINLQQRAFENMNDAYQNMLDAQRNFDRLTAEGKSDAAQIASDRVGRTTEEFNRATALYNEARLGLAEVRAGDPDKPSKTGGKPEKSQAEIDAENAAKAAADYAEMLAKLNGALDVENTLLTQGAEAADRMAYALRGVNEADIEGFVVKERAIRQERERQEAMRKAAEEAERAAEKRAEDARREAERELEAHQRKLEQSADRLAGSISDAFTDIVSQTQSVEDAFKSMVDGIISEMLRLAATKYITEPLSAALFGALSGAGGAGGSPFGPGDFPVPTGTGGLALRMPPSTTTSTGMPSIVMNVSVPINAQSLDPRTMTDLLREQKGQIGSIVGEAVRESSALRSMFKEG